MVSEAEPIGFAGYDYELLAMRYQLCIEER